MKKSLFIIGISMVILAVGFSGCGGGFEVPVIEVTGPIAKTITFQNGDVTLAGTLDLPAGEGPYIGRAFLGSGNKHKCGGDMS